MFVLGCCEVLSTPACRPAAFSCFAFATAVALSVVLKTITVHPGSPRGHPGSAPALGWAAAVEAIVVVVVVVLVALRFASPERLINAIANPASTRATTVRTIAAAIRQSGGRWISVRAAPHSRHHS